MALRVGSATTDRMNSKFLGGSDKVQFGVGRKVGPGIKIHQEIIILYYKIRKAQDCNMLQYSYYNRSGVVLLRGVIALVMGHI